ncbi:MAG: lycopene beta-cyclase CrtY, partial [Gemmatimonadota bacterium]
MHMFDYVLAGGGLQSGLIALAVRARQPEATIALIERDDALGGNHTWCFHHEDAPEHVRDWLDPLVEWSWPGYSVHFQGFESILDEPYAGVSSARLNDAVTEALAGGDGCVLRLGAEISEVHADRVVLADGDDVRGRAVIDARGARRSDASAMRAGYQKFVGLEVELSEAHGLARPILMDATVDQEDGYRFFYVLPFSDTRVLIEDTRFHDSPRLDAERLRGEVERYAGERGWVIDVVIREERGVLPMPWHHDIEPAGKAPLLAGYRGGWFHPGTGYSENWSFRA